MEHLNCLISEHAKRYPDQCALINQGCRWTYQELNSAICTLCDHLKKEGVQENQRIAFTAMSTPQTIVLFLALWRLKAIACPLSFRIPEEQLPKSLELLKPAHLLDPVQLPISSHATPSTTHWIDLDQPATFLFTSGSSGIPKVVCHSYGNHYYNALGIMEQLQLDLSSRWLLSLPLFHVSGIAILFRCFLKGSTVVLSNAIDLKSILDLNITHLSLVPTQLYRVLNEPSERLEKMKHSLKCLLLGGAPIPPSLLDAAHKLSLPIFATYGMTEMSSLIAFSDPNNQGNAGKIALYRDLKIDKDQEIWVGGKTLFKGYWDASKDAIIKADQGGWFPTKDLGRWTSDHQLEVIGRKDRQFISGGENIQPEAIESALCSLPGIHRALVLPIEDVEFGTRPIAFIDDASHQYSLESIRQQLKDRLPGFMHPIKIFSYPPELSIKPKLSSLKQHLAQILKSSAKNQE